MEYKITTPVKTEDIAMLRAGDTVLLSGIVYTARDAAHKRLVELIDKNEKLPFELDGSAIYYVGPTPNRDGQIIGSAGPTTSGRMDAYSPLLISLGQKIMIGKGKRSQEVVKAITEYGSVYLGAVGGAGALMASSVKSVEIVCWEDLGCEAVRRMEVENFHLTVIIDSQGGNLYDLGPNEYLDSIK